MFKQIVTGMLENNKEVSLVPGKMYAIDVVKTYVEELQHGNTETFVGIFSRCQYNQIVLRTTIGEKFIHVDYIKDIREVGL